MGPHEVSSDALVKLKRNASATHMRIRVGLFSISSKSSYERECKVQIFLTKTKAMIYFERQDGKRTKHKQQEQKKKTEAKHSYSVPSSFSKTCRFLKF